MCLIYSHYVKEKYGRDLLLYFIYELLASSWRKVFKNELLDSSCLPVGLLGFLSVCMHICTVYIYIYIRTR